MGFRKLKVEVELENDAMQNADAVNDVLRGVQQGIRRNYNTIVLNTKYGLRDANGNTVGFWKIVEE